MIPAVDVEGYKAGPCRTASVRLLIYGIPNSSIKRAAADGKIKKKRFSWTVKCEMKHTVCPLRFACMIPMKTEAEEIYKKKTNNDDDKREPGPKPLVCAANKLQL